MTSSASEDSESPLELLLIEDNPGDARLVRTYLEDSDVRFDLHWCSSLGEGLNALEDGGFAAVFLDLNLPDSEGVDTVKRSVDAADGGTAVIVLTGLEDTDVAVQAVQAGADEYLVKGDLDPQSVGRTLRLVLERRRAQQLQTSEEEHRLLFQDNPQPMFIFDPDTVEVVAANEAMCRLYGYSEERITNLSTVDLWTKADSPDTRYEVLQLVDGAREDGPLRHQSHDGTDLLVQTTAASVRWDGEERRLVSVQDVTEQVELEERLRYQALHDGLTELPNRTMFRKRLDQELSRARRHELLFGLLLIDLNRFKEVNDTFGHTAGDRVLAEIGRRLTRNLRREDSTARMATDLPARLGGDEFAVLMSDLDEPEDLRAGADRLLQLLEQPYSVAEQEMELTFTVGALLFGTGDAPEVVDVDQADDLLRLADLALYGGKEETGSTVSVFTSDQEGSYPHLLEREQRLRDAIEAEEFEVYVQPIVHLETDEVWGIESLARWSSSDRGMVPPGEFIPLAEEIGVIAELGEQLRSATLRHTERWTRAVASPSCMVTLNVSAQEMDDSDCVQRMKQQVRSHGVDPGRVALEVTESTLLHNESAVRDLRDAGFLILVDDFGTGFASFSYLRDLAVDGLKIDTSFVHQLGKTEHTGAVLETIIELTEKLDVLAIAEGIETEGQLARLMEFECGLGQGFLFAHPAPADEFVLPDSTTVGRMSG